MKKTILLRTSENVLFWMFDYFKHHRNELINFIKSKHQLNAIDVSEINETINETSYQTYLSLRLRLFQEQGWPDDPQFDKDKEDNFPHYKKEISYLMEAINTTVDSMRAKEESGIDSKIHDAIVLSALITKYEVLTGHDFNVEFDPFNIFPHKDENLIISVAAFLGMMEEYLEIPL